LAVFSQHSDESEYSRRILNMNRIELHAMLAAWKEYPRYFGKLNLKLKSDVMVFANTFA